MSIRSTIVSGAEPAITARVMKAVTDAGITVKIISATGTFAEQDELFSRGCRVALNRRNGDRPVQRLSNG